MGFARGSTHPPRLRVALHRPNCFAAARHKATPVQRSEFMRNPIRVVLCALAGFATICAASAQTSAQTGRPGRHRGRAVCGRQLDRYRGAHPFGRHVRDPGTTGDRRKHRWRRWHDRHHPGRARGARRLLAPVRHRRHHGDRSGHAEEAALRQHQRFAPAGLAVEQPIVLITRKDLPVTSLAEFVAYAKANHARCSSAPPAWARVRISPAPS